MMDISDDSTFDIPDEYQKKLFPTPHMPISQFIHYPFPTVSEDTQIDSARGWFSHAAPTAGAVAFLVGRPIPPQQTVDKILGIAKDMVAEGHQSIVDPRVPGLTVTFPLWAPTLWKQLLGAVRHQLCWKTAIAWLNRDTVRGEYLTDAYSAISRLPWNLPKKPVNFTASELVKFLGRAWLSDMHMDMMAWLLQKRLKMQCRTDIMVQTMPFTWMVIALGKGTKTMHQAKLLLPVTKELREGRVTEIWFPINVGDNHWIAGKLNYLHKTLAWGGFPPS
jgi:hypothetical protein